MRRGEGAYDVMPSESRFVMRTVIQMNYFRGAVGALSVGDEIALGGVGWKAGNGECHQELLG